MARAQATIEDLEAPEEGQKPAESTEGTDSREQKPSALGFFEQLSRFSTADWESHIVYIYRLSPITDRLAGGTTKYLMKYGSRFDQDTVKADHGSGRYRLQLNQTDSKGKSKTVRTYELDIEDTNFPPRVPPGEWLDDPRNKRWAWARKKEDAAAAAAPGSDPWTPERITRMVKELRPDAPPSDQMSITKAVLDAVKETRAELGAANNPQTMMTMLKELILIAKPDTPAAKPEGESQTFVLLMRMLDAAEKRAAQAIEDSREERKRAEAERQRAHELELERIKQKDVAADPLEMVEKVLTLQEKLGGGQQSRRPGWPGLLEEHADQLIELGKTAIGAISQAGYKRSQQQAQQPNPNQPAPAQPQQPAPQQQPSQQQPQPGAENVPQPQSTDPDIQFLIEIFEQQGKRLVAAFAADPDSGGDVAAAIAMPMFAGKAGYERIARMGPEKILQAMKLVADGAMYKDLLAAGTQEMLNDFIADFINPPVDDEEDEPLVPEVVQTEAKPARKKKEKVQ